ncbi:MAG: c-type cytochrome [Longimicrobiales bacterium]|nr:c-type cytochrome [Longimicrobiales bacterium]
MRGFRILTFVTLASLSACGGDDAPQDQRNRVTGADSVQAALTQYDAAAFDTIAWEAPEDAVVRGSVVFSYSCVRCHGRFAQGDGGFVSQGDTLRPPDVTVPDWRFLGDLEGLRQFIYTGSENGMPHWGLEGLKYRDVDAVARFLLEGLNRG